MTSCTKKNRLLLQFMNLSLRMGASVKTIKQMQAEETDKTTNHCHEISSYKAFFVRYTHTCYTTNAKLTREKCL